MTARPNLPAVDAAPLSKRIERQWDADIVPQLVDYIRIPARSPHFDPDWARNGHIEAAIRQAEAWVKAQGVEGLSLEIVRIGERTPVLFFDIPATGGLANGRTVLFYGHLDKQPEMTG
jgi:acetylornithine deacetylase/succinyl-diaminopimelate desuccinylase-like protein